MLVMGTATPRPESWARLPRATLPTRVGGNLPRVEVVDLRRDGLYPLSRPLRTGLIRLADEGGRAILLLNRRGEAPGAALPQLRRGLPLRPLRRQPRAARRQPAALPPLRLHPARAERVPALRVGRARAPGRRHRARQRGRQRAAAAHPGAAPRRRRDGAARAASTRRSSASRASRRPCSWARRWSRRATTSAISGWPRRSTPTRDSPGPTSAARSARSRCSRSSPAAAGGAAIRAR